MTSPYKFQLKAMTVDFNRESLIEYNDTRYIRLQTTANYMIKQNQPVLQTPWSQWLQGWIVLNTGYIKLRPIELSNGYCSPPFEKLGYGLHTGYRGHERLHRSRPRNYASYFNCSRSTCRKDVTLNPRLG